MNNHFDLDSITWDENPMRRERAAAVANAVRAHIPLFDGMKALEFGCGTGLLSFAMLPFPGTIALADTSAGMLTVAGQKIAASGAENLSTLQLDLFADPLPPQRYDLITSLMVLHHIPDTEKALSRLADLLAPGGWLCLADLDAEDGSFHAHEAGFDGHNGFDRAALAEKLRAAGFADPQFGTVYAMHKETSAGARDYTVFLVRAQKNTG